MRENLIAMKNIRQGSYDRAKTKEIGLTLRWLIFAGPVTYNEGDKVCKL